MGEESEPAFLVNAYADPIVIRINGRASFQNSGPLRDFFGRMVCDGRREFVIDFENCTTMDSTFLGIIAGAALEASSGQPPGSVGLYRLSARNLQLVRNLGLHRIAEVDAGDFPMSFGGADERLNNVRHSEEENAKMVLNAHEKLVEIDESNKAKFQDVIAFLKNQVESEGG